MKLEHFIEEIIRNNKIKTQTELVQHLEKSGVSVTQSNLSRVLKKVHAVKVTDGDNTYYIIQEQPLAAEGWIRNLVSSIEENGCNIVIKTYMAGAPIVCKFVDEHEMDEILGAMAGMDLVIIVPRDIEKIKELREKLKTILM